MMLKLLFFFIKNIAAMLATGWVNEEADKGASIGWGWSVVQVGILVLSVDILSSSHVIIDFIPAFHNHLYDKRAEKRLSESIFFVSCCSKCSWCMHIATEWTDSIICIMKKNWCFVTVSLLSRMRCMCPEKICRATKIIFESIKNFLTPGGHIYP